MLCVNETGVKRVERPIKVLQFGEGNFLRAFVDWMIDIANEKGVFDGSIAIVKPIDMGSLDTFRVQDNLYTVVLRGKEDGKVVNTHRVVTSVSKVLDCRKDYAEYLGLAELDTLEFVVSNTTEAGIVLDTSDTMNGLPRTYPGKLTQFLYKRWQFFDGATDKGLIILPVELIEDNGKKLRECVLALIDIWQLPEKFKEWVKSACTFCSTLVDRIVTGHPKAEAESLWQEVGYRDELIDIGEPFGLWVIESDQCLSNKLPLDKIGLPVVFCNDQRPYRERKVRVLNGAHTSSVLIGYLYGLDIVRDCMNDDVMGRFVRKTVMDEIVPLVPLPEDDVKAFAASVFERFENPFIDHSLLAISLNSVSKWKARVLPSFKDYVAKNGCLPKKLTFSFAALLAFYRSDDLRADGLYAKRSDGTEYVIHDGEDVLRFFAGHCKNSVTDYVKTVSENTEFWGEDLSAYDGFCDAVAKWLELIDKDPENALKTVLEED